MNYATNGNDTTDKAILLMWNEIVYKLCKYFAMTFCAHICDSTLFSNSWNKQMHLTHIWFTFFFANRLYFAKNNVCCIRISLKLLTKNTFISSVSLDQVYLVASEIFQRCATTTRHEVHSFTWIYRCFPEIDSHKWFQTINPHINFTIFFFTN